ncbi:hypothetical protein PybrP1_002513 [[Pythium] brassicae (nom. inval.)]|nr:hypothetical protein PybrP1_002513 [[Pythium] brassicae (nom. inval.)]
MIVYHDEPNFNIYLSRSKGYSRVGEHAVILIPRSKGKNSHNLGGVSPVDGSRAYEGARRRCQHGSERAI